MIDALFFSRITFLFFEATAVHRANEAVTMMAYVGCCAGGGTGGGGGYYCVQTTNPPPRATHRWENRPTRSIDRPTGTIEQLFFWGGGIFFRFFACALRPCTNPIFTSFLTQTPIMLTKELVQLPDAHSLLAQRCKLWRELPEHHHLHFVTVCGLRVVCIPTISYLHY